jgi:hypothetical protein
MGSGQSHTYDPLDLEILDRVFEAAWARFEAAAPDRERAQDDQRQKALRELIFALASGHPVDFDKLIERLDAVPKSWLVNGEVAA